MTMDATWMAEALAEARKAAAEGEVPIGAVVVHDSRVIGRGRLHSDGFAVRLPDASDDLLCTGLAAGVIDHDGCPGRRQMLGDRRTDAFRCARDNGDLTVQFLRPDRAPFLFDRNNDSFGSSPNAKAQRTGSSRFTGKSGESFQTTNEVEPVIRPG